MIENSIRTQALKFDGLTSIIKNNFHLTRKHNSDDKYVLLTVKDDPRNIELHMEENQRDALIQIDCYSKTPATAKLIALQVCLALNKQGFIDNDVNVQFAILQKRIPYFETDSGLHRESLDFTFYYNPITNSTEV